MSQPGHAVSQICCLDFALCIVSHNYKCATIAGGYLCENKVVQDVCSPRTGAGVVIANFTSTEDSVLIIFASDSSFEKRGFVIKYTENFVNYTTTSTTSSTVTSSTLSSSSSVNGVTYSSVTTETSEYNLNDFHGWLIGF